MSKNSFSHIVRARLLCEWQLKAGLGIVLSVFFCSGYFALQRYHLGNPRPMELSMVDRWVGYAPSWAIIYQSMYLMMPLAWLATTRQQLWRYTAGFIAISAVGFAWFFFDPVTGPRPAEPAVGLLRMIHLYDSPLNSFPSLHLALAVYAACFCVSVVGARIWLIAVLALWVLLIGYATLATKQHYSLDALAGLLLGVAGHWAARWIAADHLFTVISPQPEDLR